MNPSANSTPEPRRVSALIRTAAVLVLALALAAFLAPAPALAAETDASATAAIDRSYLPDASSLADSDELAEAYVDEALSASGSSLSPLADYGLSHFYGSDSYDLYVQLKDFVSQLADEGGSAVFSYDCSDYGFSGADADAAMEAALEGLQIEEVIDCLIDDCPYELYWYDKGTGVVESFTIRTGLSGSTVRRLTLSFSVISSYAGEGDYTVITPAAGGAVQTAKANAQAIVDDCGAGTSSCTVLERLEDYKDAICDLVDYDSDATTDDMDAWEIIYVFDGDEDTNVVCEGYAKAFQYLCDLTWPDNDPVTCYTVLGSMGRSGSSGSSGTHMWNLVGVEGVEGSYLVDLTNSDDGGIGADGELFLASALDANTSTVEGCTLTIPSKTVYNDDGSVSYRSAIGVSYTYDSGDVELYGEDILALAKEDFPDELSHHTLVETEEAAATCTQDGVAAYWTCSVCGLLFADEDADEQIDEPQIIEATGHSYEASWSWSDDGASARLLMVCSACGDAQTVDATVTSSTAADGSTTCVAVASFEGVEYRDSLTLAAAEEDDEAGDDSAADGGEGESEAEAEAEEEPVYQFTDVQDPELYYFDAVYALADEGIINGVSDTLYGVNQNMTRAQFATIVYRIAGEPSTDYDAGYTDVADGKYYTDAINWAAEEGVVTGYTDGSYGINDELSFEDMCLIIARYAAGGDDALQSAVSDSEAASILAAYADGGSVAAYADKGMAWCVAEGLVTGNTDGTIVPQEKVTRQRAAVVVARWQGLA